MTIDSGSRIQPEVSVELIYDARLNIPIPLLDRKAARERDDASELTVGHQHVVEVEGGRVAFSQHRVDERLWVTAYGFQPGLGVFLESWVGEPLNILLGQLISPRLTARNQGNGTSLVSLRNVSQHKADARISSLLCERKGQHNKRFWELYGLILSMIIRAGQEKADPDLLLHQLTD